MKTLATISLSLISLVLTCSAGITNDLVGKWGGTLTQNLNGQTIKARADFSFTKYEGSGLAFKSVVSLPGNPKAVASLKLRSNGKIAGTVTQGSVSFNASGTWKVDGDLLTAKFKISTSGVVVTEVMKFQLPAPGKLRLTSTTTSSSYFGSSTSRATGTLSRK